MQDADLPPLTVVLGGARSGKSRLAEKLVMTTRRPRFYLATAEAWDTEMSERIALHKQDRGGDWTTIEAPRDLCPALSRVPSGACALLDCATLWLSNHLIAGSDLEAESAALLHALGDCKAPVVVVSNEVGWSIVPENVLARQFRDEQGRLNQRLAAQADLVIGVMAGLPMVLKGALPRIAA